MSHYQQRLEQDLTRIRQHVGAMAEKVERALKNAITCTLTGDESLGSDTVLGDNPINRASRELDRLCHAFIARHLPSAGHLRLMSSIIRVNVALERIGDYAVTISREGMQLQAPPSGAMAQAIDSLAEEARQLLHKAVVAFNADDGDMARSVLPLADRVEGMMDAIYSDLFDAVNAKEPRSLVAPFVIFSLLKRVSDQAKNICEQTLFSVLGKIKKPKISKILFVDGDDAKLAPLAEALARKAYANVGEFSSVGKQPGSELDRRVVAFLDQRGVDTTGMAPRAIESVKDKLSDYDVIVALQGQVKDYFPRLPFHTSPLCWSLSSTEDDLDAIYRTLWGHIESLMTVLTGVSPQ